MRLGRSLWSLSTGAALLLIGMPSAIGQASVAVPSGAGLAVAPVQLAMSDTSRSVSTVVTNPGSEPITVQVRLFSWRMHGEDEVYEPATDAGWSPPLFELAPQASQSVRIVAKVPAGSVERSYRLIVDQLPLENSPGQLQLPVRMILPVFVEPAPGVSRETMLEWTARQTSETNRITISVRNAGSIHARLVDLSVESGGETVNIAPGLAGYALAGQAREWSYQPANTPARVTISAMDGAKTLRVTVPVLPR